MARADRRADARHGRDRAAARARPAPRAAASGADPDGHQARASLNPLFPAYRRRERAPAAPPRRRSAGSTSRAAWSRSAMTATASPSTTRGRATVVARAVRARDPPGHLRRIPALHRRWRLPPAGVLAVGRLGRRAAAGLAGAALLALRRTASGASSRCPACGRIEPAEPVCHVSFYEADAFASWAGKRLPTRGRVGARGGRRCRSPATSLESGHFHPCADAAGATGLRADDRRRLGMDRQPLCRLSAAFAEPPGAIGEYNGKFMANQMVLRGGCGGDPGRPYPHHLSQLLSARRRAGCFGGMRLAEDL